MLGFMSFYLSCVYDQFSRGQDGVLGCALTQRNSVLLPGEAGLRESVCCTHKLGLAVFHHCYLLLSIPDGGRDCKIQQYYIRTEYD